ncbi:hypothetical protein P3T73_03745 [Kiritimatiellota bacterium B12222]|nr:hypothetical protein P3T73_03745 [Kiritimatiellota bacterium B12222]
MKTPHRSHRLFFSCLMLFATGITSSDAAMLAVDWGGNYVGGGSEAFSSDGGFTGGNPDVLSPTASYSGSSATFYGKYEAFSGSPTPVSFNEIQDSGTTDRIQLKTADSAGGQNTGFLVLWKQADFLNGLDSGMVGLDASSSLQISLTTYANQDATDSGRLVLRLGSDYYTSNRIFTGTGTTTTPDPTALTFYAYDPVTTTININNPTVSTDIVSGGVISGVTEIGFYFESIASANAVRVSEFSVNMVSIPEASTWALVVLGLIPIALTRKKKLRF